VRSKSLIDAAVVAAFFGAVATLGSSWITSGDAGAQRAQQADQRSADLQVGAYKATLDARKEACTAAIHYFEDEKPNQLADQEQKRVVETMVSILQNDCPVPSPSLPVRSNPAAPVSPKAEAPKIAPSKGGVYFGGGDFSGGGADRSLDGGNSGGGGAGGGI